MSTLAIREYLEVWRWSWIKAHPGRSFGIVLHLLLRTLFAVFWLFAGMNKIKKDWLTTDILKRIFEERLTEMPPDAFASLFLQEFAIPLYLLVAWVIAIGELYAAVGLMLGCTTRLAAATGLFILVGLAVGGYYDASLIPFFILSVVFLRWPSGLWFGLDRWLSRRYPNAPWFR